MDKKRKTKQFKIVAEDNPDTLGLGRIEADPPILEGFIAEAKATTHIYIDAMG